MGCGSPFRGCAQLSAATGGREMPPPPHTPPSLPTLQGCAARYSSTHSSSAGDCFELSFTLGQRHVAAGLDRGLRRVAVGCSATIVVVCPCPPAATPCLLYRRIAAVHLRFKNRARPDKRHRAHIAPEHALTFQIALLPVLQQDGDPLRRAVRR